MRKALRYGLLFVLVYLGFLIAELPATHAYGWLKARGAVPVQLYQLSGSAWSGSAASATLGAARLDDFSWHWRPQGLLRGRLELALAGHAADGEIETVAGRSLGGARYLQDVHGTFPLAGVARALGPLPIGLTGQLKVDLDRLELAPARIAAVDGVLTVAEAGVGPPLNLPVGGFALTLQTNDQGIRGILKDNGGPLQADGVLTLDPLGNYRLTAMLAARDPQRADLRQALGFFGSPSPTGKVTISRRGHLPLERYLP